MSSEGSTLFRIEIIFPQGLLEPAQTRSFGIRDDALRAAERGSSPGPGAWGVPKWARQGLAGRARPSTPPGAGHHGHLASLWV